MSDQPDFNQMARTTEAPLTNGEKMVERGERGRVLPGSVLNPKGRPKSSRHKLSEDFISKLAQDFAEHGMSAIETVRKEEPAQYLRVVAAIVPKTLELDDAEDEDGVFGVALITKSAITALIERGRQDGGD